MVKARWAGLIDREGGMVPAASTGSARTESEPQEERRYMSFAECGWARSFPDPLVELFDFVDGMDLVVAVGEVGDPGAGYADAVAGFGGLDARLVRGDDLDVEGAVVVRTVGGALALIRPTRHVSWY